MENTQICAVVVNNMGDILTYTVRSTKQQCEEHAIEFFGENVWNMLVKLGCKVVQCELKVLE